MHISRSENCASQKRPELRVKAGFPKIIIRLQQGDCQRIFQVKKIDRTISVSENST